jgi:phage terminase large subunit-like protein
LPGKRYVIGVDPCAGTKDGDFACVQVIDESGLQCAELLARMTPEELAKEVERLAWKYSKAVVAVERNSNGREVLTHLGKTDVELYEDENEVEGLDTNRKTRPEVVAKLVAFAKDHMSCFQSRRLLQQMRSFIRRYDGRSQAAPGEHDDAVMAMGIALWVREQLPSRR